VVRSAFVSQWRILIAASPRSDRRTRSRENFYFDLAGGSSGRAAGRFSTTPISPINCPAPTVPRRMGSPSSSRNMPTVPVRRRKTQSGGSPSLKRTSPSAKCVQVIADLSATSAGVDASICAISTGSATTSSIASAAMASSLACDGHRLVEGHRRCGGDASVSVPSGRA